MSLLARLALFAMMALLAASFGWWGTHMDSMAPAPAIVVLGMLVGYIALLVYEQWAKPLDIPGIRTMDLRPFSLN